MTLVGRGEHVRVINEKGVRVTTKYGADRIARGASLRAITSLDAVTEHVDYLLMSVKDRAMPGVLKDLAAARDRIGCAFSLQNGVDHDEQLALALGREKVIGALTMEGAAMPSPGVIEHLLASTTYLGELSGTRTPRVLKLAAALQRGGLRAEIITEIRIAQWTKFIQSCAASGVCGVTRLGYAPATYSLHGARLYVSLVQEGVAVMRAQGMEPGPFFTDAARVCDLANLPLDDAVDMVRRTAQALIARGYTGTTSLARDLAAGKVSEVDAIIGAMIRIGEQSGVATPTIRTVYWAVKAADSWNGSRAPGRPLRFPALPVDHDRR